MESYLGRTSYMCLLVCPGVFHMFGCWVFGCIWIFHDMLFGCFPHLTYILLWCIVIPCYIFAMYILDVVGVFSEPSSIGTSDYGKWLTHCNQCKKRFQWILRYSCGEGFSVFHEGIQLYLSWCRCQISVSRSPVYWSQIHIEVISPCPCDRYQVKLCLPDTKALFQYSISRLILRFLRSYRVPEPRYLYLELSNRSEIWQATGRQHCWNPCQMSEWYHQYNIQSLDLAIRRLTLQE